MGNGAACSLATLSRNGALARHHTQLISPSGGRRSKAVQIAVLLTHWLLETKCVPQLGRGATERAVLCSVSLSVCEINHAAKHINTNHIHIF